MKHIPRLLAALMSLSVCILAALGCVELAHSFESWLSQDFYFGLAAIFACIAVGSAIIASQMSVERRRESRRSAFQDEAKPHNQQRRER